jgi:predicted permease
MLRAVRKIENLHIACWLLKDTCWVMDLHIAGIVMIFPTLFLAFYITYRFRSVPSEFYHNIAVCSWIMANTIWMIGEFFYNDTLRPYAVLFFLAGLIVLAVYYIFIRNKVKESELTDII